MNEIQILDQQIFDFLHKYHLDEKKAGREFYFRIYAIIRPELLENGGFYWFYYNNYTLTLSFWEDQEYCKVNLEIYVSSSGSLTVKCTIMFPDEKSLMIGRYEKPEIQQKIRYLSEVAKALGWSYSHQGVAHIYFPNYYAYHEYSKFEFSVNDIIAFLRNFIENDKKLIDEIFLVEKEDSEKLLFPINKADFEHNLFKGFFLKSQPQKEISNLPTRLVRIHLRNFKSIKEIKIDNISINAQWIFLTGENGIGKTVLLQAIGYGIFGFSELTDGERKWFDNENIQIHATRCINNEYYNKSYYNRKYFDSPNYRENQDINVAFFGASRLETLINGKTQNKTAHILGKSTQLRNIDNHIFQLRINTLRQKQFHLLKNTICNILNLRDIEIDRRENRTVYFEHDAEKPVPFSQLSAGYKNIINLIGNIVVELSATQTPEITDTKLLTGIVIIDEIEAHLHPKMQRFLVEKLTELFPKVQFIVSTHSPIPLLGAPKESVILRIDRTKEEGITVKRMDEIVPIQGLLPNDLLASPIFGFDI